ncbi:MAG: hypothetical protein ACRD8O_06890 [Bryobacteraceae bacterium]
MGWFALIRVALAFTLLYVAFPAFSFGSRTNAHWTHTAAVAFARTSSIMQFAVLLLGIAGLGLPGAVWFAYIAAIAIVALKERRSMSWLVAATRVLEWAERFRPARIRLRPFPIRFSAPVVMLVFVVTVFFCVRAWFPVYNVRFSQLQDYSRALSLSVLVNGQPGTADTSIPLLAPVMFLTALTSPAVVSLSGPLFAALFVIATAFTAFEYTRSRSAALLAGCLVTVLPGADTGLASHVEMAAAMAMVAAGLAPRARGTAVLAAATSVSISVSIAAAAAWAAGVACVMIACLVARAGSRLAAGAAAISIAASILSVTASRPDGPFQYEAAARMTNHLAATLPRNTWTIVSPSQELPLTYGRGWHVELAEFVSSFSAAQVTDRAFRWPYPTRDVFFFVEREPLRMAESSGNAVNVTTGVSFSIDPVVLAYTTPLGRSALQFQAAELIAAYAGSHGDLQVVFNDGRLVIYRAPGSLP